MIKCVIFDLDGTLLSTLDTITFHLNNTLRERGLCEITVEDCRAFIGNGAKKLVSRAVGKSGTDDTDTVLSVLGAYNEAYNDDPLPLTYPYSGIPELVDMLRERGIRLAVVTNKPENTAKKLIEYFFPGKFDLVVGGRTGAELKPDPTETLAAINTLGCEPCEAVFVGDTSVDICTAKNSKVALAVGVSWGFRDRGELESAGADLVIDHPLSLLAEVT